MKNIEINIPIVKIAPKALAIKLSVAGEQSVRNEHPWLFADSIVKEPETATTGDVAVIFSFKKNKPIGVGLYDAHSPIRIKMLHFGSGIKLEEAFFLERIAQAYSIRQPLLQTKTTSYRLLFGENDGFPGLIADVYATTLVLKLYSAMWFPYLSLLVPGLINVSSCDTVVVRLSRNVEKISKELKDGTVIYGQLQKEEIPFIEHGVLFAANVIKGHKTGYFLDHRYNRKTVGLLSKGKTVLDVFSYAGGFSVHALVNGATEVTSLDISKQALEVAKINVRRNHYKGTHKTIAGDAFVEMQKLIAANKRYDVVVIDPPSFAKSLNEIDVAKKKYVQLVQLGEQLTNKGGLLVVASCSSRITSATFFQLTKDTLQQQTRPFKTEKKTLHDIDHPVTFTEGAYLKCIYYRF